MLSSAICWIVPRVGWYVFRAGIYIASGTDPKFHHTKGFKTWTEPYPDRGCSARWVCIGGWEVCIDPPSAMNGQRPAWLRRSY